MRIRPSTESRLDKKSTAAAEYMEVVLLPRLTRLQHPFAKHESMMVQRLLHTRHNSQRAMVRCALSSTTSACAQTMQEMVLSYTTGACASDSARDAAAPLLPLAADSSNFPAAWQKPTDTWPRHLRPRPATQLAPTRALIADDGEMNSITGADATQTAGAEPRNSQLTAGVVCSITGAGAAATAGDSTM